MKMMKKLAMSLALGLGLSLLGGGQGTVARQAQRSVFADLDQDAEIILQEMNKGLPNCGNVLVAYINIENFLEPRYIVLQSGLTCSVSRALERKINARGLGNTRVIDGAEVIGIVSGTPEERRKQIVEDIRTLAGGKRLTGRGRTDQEQNADVRERLEDIILALQIYVATCQTAGFTARPNWAEQTRGWGITTEYYRQQRPRTWCDDSVDLMNEIARIPANNQETVLSHILQYLNSGLASDERKVNPVTYRLPPEDSTKYAKDCAGAIQHSWGGQAPYFWTICNALRWFRYALHTEIQLALLPCPGGPMMLVPHSPILSLKDPCPSCEQGANNAWNHQDHKFFSIQRDTQGDKHQFSTDDGTIIQTRYCTWK